MQTFPLFAVRHWVSVNVLIGQIGGHLGELSLRPSVLH